MTPTSQLGLGDYTPPPLGFEGVPELTPTPSSGPLSLDTVLQPYVIIFCLAFIVAYVFTPLMRVVALQYDIVDRPDAGEGARKMHRRPTAYLGGMAVFLGFISALAAGQWLSTVHHPLIDGFIEVPVPVVAGAVVIVLLGLIDDVRGIRPLLKILGQVLAAVCLLYFGIGNDVASQFTDFGFAWLHQNIGISVDIAVEQVVGTLASWTLVVSLVVFCCNASNLLDGLDGLCGGVTAIIALGLVVVSAHLAMQGIVDDAYVDAARLAVSLALFGSVLGFLPFNFNPASIFMGDAGSLLMGFVIATMIILLGEAGGKWMLGGLVMFSLPVLDTALAFARRWLKGRPLFSADKHHFHHQLTARGLSVRKAVAASYLLTIFFVASGALLVFLRTRYAVAFYLVLFGCILVAAYKIGLVHERSRDDQDLDEDEETEDEPATALAKHLTDEPTPAANNGVPASVA
jgi:UDP-GlcNAc:undecaprenyl-phosphate GlcNAc-1-phosphate transferase